MMLDNRLLGEWRDQLGATTLENQGFKDKHQWC